MKTFSQLLIENRVEVLFDKYKQKMVDVIQSNYMWRGVSDSNIRDSVVQAVFGNLSYNDPTTNKIYLDWIIRQLLKNDLVICFKSLFIMRLIGK